MESQMKYSFHLHEKIHEGVKPFECTNCDKRSDVNCMNGFMQERNHLSAPIVTRDLRIHTDEKPYEHCVTDYSAKSSE